MGRIASFLHEKCFTLIIFYLNENVHPSYFVRPSKVLPCLQRSVPICICQVHSDSFSRDLWTHLGLVGRWKQKRKQKHCSALISLIRYICYISGEFPFRAFEMHEADSLPICCFFPPFFVGLQSVLWPLRELSLHPGKTSFLGCCVHSVRITAPNSYSYANFNLELYFSVCLCADTCTCCLFSCIMHMTEAFLWLLLLLLNPSDVNSLSANILLKYSGGKTGERCCFDHFSPPLSFVPLFRRCVLNHTVLEISSLWCHKGH